MTPEELKQQAHKEFDKLSIKLKCEEMPELASLLQKLSDTAFEKQKVQVYKMLDSLIDRTVQATKERIVIKLNSKQKALEKELKKYTILPFSREAGEVRGELIMVSDIISLITNKSNTNK